MTQADLGTGVAFRTKRQAEVRAVGEVVGRGRAVSGTDLDMREQLLGQTARIGNLAGTLAGEIRETIIADCGAETVGGGDLPIGPGPDTEALMRVRPSQAIRGHVEQLKGRALIGKPEAKREISSDLMVDEGRDLIAVQQVAFYIRGIDARDRATGKRPEDGGLRVRILKAQARREQPAAIPLPIRQARGAAVIRQAGLAVVRRADEVEHQVRRQTRFVLEVGAQRIAIAIRTPTVVVRGREADRSTIRRSLRAGGVVREDSQPQRTTTIGTPFGDERRTGLG